MRTMFTSTVMATCVTVTLFAAVPCDAASYHYTYNPTRTYSGSYYSTSHPHYYSIPSPTRHYSGSYYSSGNPHYEFLGRSHRR